MITDCLVDYQEPFSGLTAVFYNNWVAVTFSHRRANPTGTIRQRTGWWVKDKTAYTHGWGDPFRCYRDGSRYSRQTRSTRKNTAS